MAAILSRQTLTVFGHYRHILFDIPAPSIHPLPMNISLSKDHLRFTGAAGSLLVPDDDEVSRRLAMLIEGECEELGPIKAAQKYGFTRQRYYQILADFYEEGAQGLILQRPGPKTHYRRTDQAVRLVIRCRFLDPDSSPAVIGQKLRQQNLALSNRSIERIVADYGLQKKTLRA
jgi:hypothetical protein